MGFLFFYGFVLFNYWQSALCDFGFLQRTADGLAEARKGKTSWLIIILLCVNNPVPEWSGFTKWAFHQEL